MFLSAFSQTLPVHPRVYGADTFVNAMRIIAGDLSPYVRSRCSLRKVNGFLHGFIPMRIGADLRIFDNHQSLVHQKAHPRTYEANNHSFTTRIVRVRFIPAYTGRTLNPSRKSSGLMDKRLPFASTSYDKISMYHLFGIYFCG